MEIQMLFMTVIKKLETPLPCLALHAVRENGWVSLMSCQVVNTPVIHVTPILNQSTPVDGIFRAWPIYRPARQRQIKLKRLSFSILFRAVPYGNLILQLKFVVSGYSSGGRSEVTNDVVILWMVLRLVSVSLEASSEELLNVHGSASRLGKC